VFGCSGIARIDFLYDKKNNELYANEVNTLPGTLYHHLWKESGMEVNELIEELINLAISKNDEKRKINFTFKSDIFEHLGSMKFGSGKLIDS
jgi:D-alanine-D-alanine ligase